MGRRGLFALFIMFFVVLHTGMVWANVVLKVVAVNPSKEQQQGVTVKALLPKEVKPGDVVDSVDLQVIYDAQENCYVAYGRFDLGPGETLERTIEIRDIWVIPNTEIEAVKKDLDKLSDLLEDTRFSDRRAFLRNSIESKLNQIIESQKESPPNPEQLISRYRENLSILESAKADLILLRSLLTQSKTLSSKIAWRTIISIIIFLGALSGIFCFIWQKKVRSIDQEKASPEFGKE
jgi:hypothetical protein